MSGGSITFRPLTIKQWPDLVEFFQSHGNPNYCWCSYWRLSSRDYSQSKRTERKQALKDFIERGIPTGILGYLEDRAVGWCSVAPRESYVRIERAKSIKRVDNRQTWSIVCFYLDPAYQGQGLSSQFIRAAVKYAKAKGAEAVEAYPVEPVYDEQGNWQPAKNYRFMGYRSTFERNGFQDVTPSGSRRIVMRYLI